MGKVLDGSEVELFDCINQDLIELAGEEINYYAQGDPRSKKTRGKRRDGQGRIDPLYGEYTDASEPRFQAHRVMALIKYPEYTVLAEETGFGREWDAMVYISRAALDEKNLPYPSEADVVELWRTPYHDRWSMGKGMFFDVLKAKHDGHINDSPTFTQFELTLKRRSQFGAERRIDPP